MGDEAFAAIGRIVKTHGLQGEVSVKSYTEASLDVLLGVAIWFVPPASVRTSRVQGVRPGPKGPLVKFEGVDTAEAAASLCGTEILVSAEELPPEFSDEIETEEIVGYTVMDVQRGLLGEIVDVIITGANDVWVVEGPLGEVLIPVIDDVVLEYDEPASMVTVRLLPGLIEEPEVDR